MSVWCGESIKPRFSVFTTEHLFLRATLIMIDSSTTNPPHLSSCPAASRPARCCRPVGSSKSGLGKSPLERRRCGWRRRTLWRRTPSPAAVFSPNTQRRHSRPRGLVSPPEQTQDHYYYHHEFVQKKTTVLYASAQDPRASEQTWVKSAWWV